MEIVKIGNNDLQVKVYKDQRVVTFKDIDRVHERESETAKYRFRDNKKHFISGVDYFEITRNDVGADFATTYGFSNKAPKGILVTESGYLMIVKSFTDDLAWKVQRDLVNTYFKFKEVVQNFNSSYPIDTNELNMFLMETKRNLPCMYAQINHIESALDEVLDNMTLSTRQQEIIHETARKRINHLLGGAHSPEYKQNARCYMINLWNGLKASFHCGSSYKDLNPKDFEKAIDYINHWTYED